MTVSSLHGVALSLLVVSLPLGSACGTEDNGPEIEDFVVPLEESSLDGALTATLVEANPSPPAKGSNQWVIEVADADGNPVESDAFRMRLFMPKHGHGGAIPTITASDVPGEYNVRLSFSMGGMWEARLYKAGSAADGDVVFYVGVAD